MDTHPSTARSQGGVPRSLIAIALAGLLVVALGPVAFAAPPDEVPGNNGTVKIHEGAGEPASETRNEPHVCTFHLHFFFADAGDSGTWEIQEWSPGDKGTVALTGQYTTDENGEDRDPDAGTYSLPDGHYKLFWDGDLETNKHDKHKVFWVDCGDVGGVSETPTPPEQTPTPPEQDPDPARSRPRPRPSRPRPRRVVALDPSRAPRPRRVVALAPSWAPPPRPPRKVAWPVPRQRRKRPFRRPIRPVSPTRAPRACGRRSSSCSPSSRR